MISKISLIISIAFMLGLSACQKNDNAVIANRAVIVGYLIPGKTIQVKIYSQKAFDDTATYGAPLTGLSPTISEGDNGISLTETAAGTYTSSYTDFLSAGKTYTLRFVYNGEEVSATTTMPGKPQNFTLSATDITMPEASSGPPAAGSGTDSIAISFRWSNPDSLYHVLVLKNIASPAFLAAGRRGSPSLNITINAKQAAGYDMPFQTINYLGDHQAILYSINKEYADVLTTNAGSSSQQLNNPPGNITNGYGIFTAMQADTLTFFVRSN